MSKCVCGKTTGLWAFKQGDKWVVGFDCYHCGRHEIVEKKSYKTQREATNRVAQIVCAQDPAAAEAADIFNEIFEVISASNSLLDCMPKEK